MGGDDQGSFHDGSGTVPATFWRFVDVEQRLIEAMSVVVRSPDRERKWLGASGSSIWRMVQDEELQADDKPIVTRAFTRQQQALSSEAMGWVAAWVPSGPTRRVLGIALVAQVLDDGERPDWPWIWARMGGKAGGWTTEGLRKRYSRAITAIAKALNARRSAA